MPEPAAWVGAGQDWTGSTTLRLTNRDESLEILDSKSQVFIQDFFFWGGGGDGVAGPFQMDPSFGERLRRIRTLSLTF